MATGVDSAGAEGNILVAVIRWETLQQQIAEMYVTKGTTNVGMLVDLAILNVWLLAICS